MSRIEGGVLHAQKQPYPLGALIATVVARLQLAAPERPIVTEVPGDFPPIALDPVQIEQVLTNLIENALKYSPPATPITVSATIRPRGRTGPPLVVISVADRGPGIPVAEQAHVFDKFYRLRQDAAVRGSGLGLAIARGLVEANGGHIWVDNRPGGGARFNIALPADLPPDQEAAAPQHLPSEPRQAVIGTPERGEA